MAQIAGTGGWRLGLPHSRPAHLLIWVARGQGHALLDGPRHALAANTALFVPSGTLLALRGTSPLSGSVVIFPDAEDTALPAEPLLARVPAVQAQQDLAGLTAAMAEEQRRGGDFHGQAARAHGVLIAVWLKRARLAAPAPAPLRADQRLAREFARLLAARYRSGDRTDAYAAALGVSPAHLGRACHRATGLSAAALLNQRLAHAARWLLADTPHPVSRIAAHLGFGSAATFTRFIQNHTGQTPTALRADAASRRAQRH